MHEGLALHGCFKIFFHGSQSERYTGNQTVPYMRFGTFRPQAMAFREGPLSERIDFYQPISYIAPNFCTSPQRRNTTVS